MRARGDGVRPTSRLVNQAGGINARAVLVDDANAECVAAFAVISTRKMFIAR